jgi:hypothetical protein
MAEEWSESPAVGGAAEPLEIKLFGRWSSSDVQVSDISLTVSERKISIELKKIIKLIINIIGLHRSKREIRAIFTAFIGSLRVKKISKGSVPYC